MIHAIIAVSLWLCVIALIAYVINHWLMVRANTRPLPPPRPVLKDTRYDRIRRNGGRHTDQEWLDLCVEYGHKCPSCGKSKPLTKDHIVPIAKGGTDSIDNIQPLCRSCNSIKGTKTIKYHNRARHIASCPARLSGGN
jgi:5-methylcytosine-specific restriction endonuclease McrA